MKALIASQDSRTLSWVRSALGPDWEVVVASDGLEARCLTEQEGPDLLISDETMEHYGAFGLVREVKLLRRPPAAIILLERAQDAWLAKWSNADAWLVRPVDPFALAEIARELTRQPAPLKRA